MAPLALPSFNGQGDVDLPSWRQLQHGARGRILRRIGCFARRRSHPHGSTVRSTFTSASCAESVAALGGRDRRVPVDWHRCVLAGVPGNLATSFSYAADFDQTVWFLDWVPHALAHGLNPFFSNALYVPTGVNLAQNTSTPLLGLITAPFAPVLSPLVRANLLMVLAMPISATAAFVVLRKWQVWGPAAALGGLVYGFSPYMVGQSIAHLELMFVPLPPFIALTVASILQNRGSSRRLGVQLGLLVAAQYLISPEVLAIVAILTVAAVVCVAIRHPAECTEDGANGVRCDWHRSGGGGRAVGLSRLDGLRWTPALHGGSRSNDEPVPQRPAELLGPGTSAASLIGDAVARATAWP